MAGAVKLVADLVAIRTVHRNRAGLTCLIRVRGWRLTFATHHTGSHEDQLGCIAPVQGQRRNVPLRDPLAECPGVGVHHHGGRADDYLFGHRTDLNLEIDVNYWADGCCDIFAANCLENRSWAGA